MYRQEIRKELAEVFREFCISLGFTEFRTDDAYPGYTKMLGIGNHALSVSVDWRDNYLDMKVVRMVHGAFPTWNSEMDDHRLHSIPIRHIYGFEIPDEINEIKDRDEQLCQTLRYLIAAVMKHPEVLMDYIDNIEANTTPEKTREYLIACCQRIIDKLDEDYRNGKYELKTYQLLRRRVVRQRDGYLGQTR